MTIDLNWYYQIWIGTEHYGDLSAVYHYSNCSLSDAISRAQKQFWIDYRLPDEDYPDHEPNWNDPKDNDIDFYPSLVQRSRSEINEIYTHDSPDSIEDAIKEKNS